MRRRGPAGTLSGRGGKGCCRIGILSGLGGTVLTRLINVPVAVRVDAAGKPLDFTYKGLRHRIVRVLEVWQEAGEWWEGQGDRTVYRVATAGGGIFELDYRHNIPGKEVVGDDNGEAPAGGGLGGAGEWFLYKVYD